MSPAHANYAMDTAEGTVKSELPPIGDAPTWEELTGFTDKEEDEFNRLAGHYCALLASSTVARFWDTPEEDEAWAHLQDDESLPSQNETNP